MFIIGGLSHYQSSFLFSISFTGKYVEISTEMPVSVPVSKETTPYQSGISLTSEGPLHLAKLLEVGNALLCSFKYCDSLYPILQTKAFIKSTKKALKQNLRHKID